MPLRSLLKYLANNEKLIQRLAESYPVRRAAQLSIAIFFRSKEKLSSMDPTTLSRLKSLYRRFGENLKEGIDDAKKQLKK